jgi:membrane protease YdiL (CAAX protease family)
MNEKESHDLYKKQETTISKEKLELNGEEWSYCPVCGSKILNILKFRFCIKCGTNLRYLKKHKRLQPRKVVNPYMIPKRYPQPYTPPTFYGTKKIPDNEIIHSKDHELWGTSASLAVPLGAFLLMNFLSTGILTLIIFISMNLEVLFNFIITPYFLIFSAFFELIFILVPIKYVEKYLENPTLENRLGLLGFTLKGFDKKGIIREVLIGIGFAVIGVLLVVIVSYLTEVLLEIFFGIEIVRNISSAPSDVELIISTTDIISLIFLCIVMITIVGTSEEILFRGFMQKGLMRSLGNKAGIIITAFIFAIIHVLGVFLMLLETPLLLLISFLLSFIPYFAISLLLCFLFYWRQENLIAVVITHGVYNALTILLAFLIYNIF